jgi:hypothetical protein
MGRFVKGDAAVIPAGRSSPAKTGEVITALADIITAPH